ncbi:hypothetical protein FKG94_02770 [Exilibacterium tricleocarpae]|uniref:Uncharacterized protein n=1 Tax=Exilibacterium tricleocarpae TaxID=2591008 RepID=A0A545U6M9_9GAMM|nr:CS1-pili formation C-terminal domain-containing protein [Exilibacterium tricleocarpae]TQV85129.1 hypothetical protein FKG94_02770 [Exilibacterium tricleocarpae]
MLAIVVLTVLWEGLGYQLGQGDGLFPAALDPVDGIVQSTEAVPVGPGVWSGFPHKDTPQASTSTPAGGPRQLVAAGIAELNSAEPKSFGSGVSESRLFEVTTLKSTAFEPTAITPTTLRSTAPKPTALTAIAVESKTSKLEAPAPLTPKLQTKAKAPAVPPGFEFLLEPQTTLVDVYYGGQFLVSTLATYTPGEITFSNPEEVVARIPNLLSRSRTLEVLSQGLASNESLLCRASRTADCGKLPSLVTGVIFDESGYRVDLFVSPEELSVQQLTVPKFLPASDAGLSFIHGISAAYSGTRSQDEDYSINGSTLIALGESRLRMFSNLSKRDDLVFDLVALENDFEGKSRQIGLLQTNNQDSEFLPPLQIAGIRLASTLDTRNDLDFSEGTPLAIFLTNRSRVELLRDGRLISADVYPAGNQVLDTSLLPSGAYDITIRVLEGATLVFEEIRFYRKTNQIPPTDQSVYFLEAGRLMADEADNTFPDSRDNWLVRGSYSTRVADSLGVQGGGAVTDTDALVEAGVFFLGRHLNATLSAAQTSRGDSGYFVSTNARIGDLFINGNFRELDVETRGPLSPDDELLLGEEASAQANLRLTYPLGKGRIDFEHRLNERNGDRLASNTLSLNLPTLRFSDTAHLLTDFSVTEQEGDWQALIRVSINFSSDHWQYRASQSRFEEKNGNADDISQVSVNWNDRELLTSNLDVGLIAQNDNGAQSVDADMRWESSRAQIRASLNQRTLDGDTETGYSGVLTTSLIGDTEGLAMGGREINQSAVIIEMDSEKYDGHFDVLVDDAVRSYTKPGRISVVNLRPFETYRVKVKDTGEQFLAYEQKEEEITLYPGNVKRIKWTVARIDVVFGRIVTDSGAPLANALIEGVEGLAVTDEFGLFQAELKQGVKQLEVRTRTDQCRVAVPDYQPQRQIGRLGTLVCR